MKHILLIWTLILSMNLSASEQTSCPSLDIKSLIESLRDAGYSENDIGTIIKITVQNIASSNSSKMQKGTVKFFNEAKGFGFIVSDDGAVYEFRSQQDLQEGDSVTFRVSGDGKKGLNAVNVKKA